VGLIVESVPLLFDVEFLFEGLEEIPIGRGNEFSCLRDSIENIVAELPMFRGCRCFPLFFREIGELPVADVEVALPLRVLRVAGWEDPLMEGR